MITWILSWLAEPRSGENSPSSDVTAQDAFARAAEADRQMRLLKEISVTDRFNRDEAVHWRRVAVALSTGRGVRPVDLEELRRWKKKRPA